MDIQFQQLDQVDPQDIIALMNNPLVRRQIPLTFDDFNLQDCQKFVHAKTQMWQEHGYGPWAFVVDSEFAAWGGLQPEFGMPDLALVLHPKYWGIGKTLTVQIIEKAFTEMNFDQVTVLFPPMRTRVKGLLKLGFKQLDERVVDDKTFIRYVLLKQDWNFPRD
ncbi:hypothetical protein NBRC116188_07010 [Oceaniserpentilla sp. 4NH20-0058]|uniref:GNAT family N-acetyltransferase n=1 Tax=Oceaniserpentilla sp. 4NH20-0058 TaxID=3127660 RepID=UPI00310259D8